VRNFRDHDRRRILVRRADRHVPARGAAVCDARLDGQPTFRLVTTIR
jgi:hypothetical protein